MNGAGLMYDVIMTAVILNKNKIKAQTGIQKQEGGLTSKTINRFLTTSDIICTDQTHTRQQLNMLSSIFLM